MHSSRFSGSLSSPSLDVAIDMGNPFLNVTVDGFLKIGTVRSRFSDLFLILISAFLIQIQLLARIVRSPPPEPPQRNSTTLSREVFSFCSIDLRSYINHTILTELESIIFVGSISRQKAEHSVSSSTMQI